MKIIVALYILISFSILQSCSDNITNSVNDELVEPIIFYNGNLNSLTSDSISINSMNIENDILVVDYTIVGCESNSVYLFSESGFEETSPVQIRMRLVQHSFNDSCNTKINGKAYFDLKSVASLYKMSYRSNNGVVSLSVYDSIFSNNNLPKLSYKF